MTSEGEALSVIVGVVVAAAELDPASAGIVDRGLEGERARTRARARLRESE